MNQKRRKHVKRQGEWRIAERREFDQRRQGPSSEMRSVKKLNIIYFFFLNLVYSICTLLDLNHPLLRVLSKFGKLLLLRSTLQYAEVYVFKKALEKLAVIRKGHKF